ncbi:hypothetical protein JCM15519_37220 [Fundidesulfovibrio butyratiphilus]
MSTKETRSRLIGQKPCCIWFTGLSGAGKSTLAQALETHLHARGKLTMLLDGDAIRHTVSSDLGFSEEDRSENIRRTAHIASLFVEAGVIVLVAFISPMAQDRAQARDLFAPGEFFEIFVDAPLSVCQERDVKGLYAKVRQGALKQFTGIDSPYQPPATPEAHVRTNTLTVDECIAEIMAGLGPRIG